MNDMAVLAVMSCRKNLILVDKIVLTEKGLIFERDWACPLSMMTFFFIFFFFSNFNLTFIFFLINFDFIITFFLFDKIFSKDKN